MTVQYKFFVLPVRDTQEAEAELNRFLRSVRVLAVHKEFVNHGETSFWCMAVEYLAGIMESNNKHGRAGKSKVDYKEILSPQDFAVFAKLRDWRKEVAAKEAVPVYIVFTNEQLANIAQKHIKTSTDLLSIDKVGDARVKKYAQDVIRIVLESETSKQ